MVILSIEYLFLLSKKMQLYILCILLLFDTTACFSRSLPASSGRISVHKKSKRREATPYRKQV